MTGIVLLAGAVSAATPEPKPLQWPVARDVATKTTAIYPEYLAMAEKAEEGLGRWATQIQLSTIW